MGKVLEQYKHLGTTQYECAYCSKAFLVVTCFDNKKNPSGKRFCCKRHWYDYKKANNISYTRGRKGMWGPNSGSIKKGDRKSPETEFKPGTQSGDKNTHWKGGITPLNTRIRQSSEYKNWRKQVFERDDYTCQMCSVRGGVLHADHIKQFAFHPELRFDINNGRTLCVDCHKTTPTYLKGRLQVA